jgi:hypothetical protein
MHPAPHPPPHQLSAVMDTTPVSTDSPEAGMLR